MTELDVEQARDALRAELDEREDIWRALAEMMEWQGEQGVGEG